MPSISQFYMCFFLSVYIKAEHTFVKIPLVLRLSLHGITRQISVLTLRWLFITTGTTSLKGRN